MSLVEAPASDALGAELSDDRLDTPALIVDLDILAANIGQMADLTRRAGVRLRPHVKTHKSVRIARMQLEAGASGISVAKVGEAEVMRAGGIDDIFIVYPVVGTAKLDRLAPLVADGGVRLATDSLDVAEGYSRLATRLSRRIPVVVEIDAGMRRVGVDPARASVLGVEIDRLPGLEVVGLTVYAGHTHDVETQPEIEAIASDEARAIAIAREGFDAAGLPVEVVSAGSTITTPYLSASDGVTEVRPGTYVLNDYRTLELYACTPPQLAASMLATVVSRGPGRAVIDAGNKTLTLTRTDQHGYGRLRHRPRSAFRMLSEEHGVLDLDAADEDLRIGDRVEVLPIHICAWMDLQREAYGSSGGRIREVIPIEAMRCSR
jgi:D-serine deaminase-like pyridoxal phosphate-dependent protein